MADTGAERTTHAAQAVAAAGCANSRWLLAAGIVAILVASAFRRHLRLCASLACLALLLAAALLPTGGASRSAESAAAIEASGLQRLVRSNISRRPLPIR